MFSSFLVYFVRESQKGIVRLDLCSFNTGAGSLSPDNDTCPPQLHDRDGGSDDDDDDDDESRHGTDSYDDDILYHMKGGGVVQIQLCRHQIVHSDDGLRLNRWLHFHL